MTTSVHTLYVYKFSNTVIGEYKYKMSVEKAIDDLFKSPDVSTVINLTAHPVILEDWYFKAHVEHTCMTASFH